MITDTAGGAAQLSLTPVNYSTAAKDLGLDEPVGAGGTTIAGRDVNRVEASGIFAHIAALRDALRTSDTRAITRASEGLKDDYDRLLPKT